MKLNELIKKYELKVKMCETNLMGNSLSKYEEILSDLESHKELVYEILCGQYKYIYDKEKDFIEIADGIYQCIVDEEVFYQHDRYDGKIYNLTFLEIIGE